MKRKYDIEELENGLDTPKDIMDTPDEEMNFEGMEEISETEEAAITAEIEVDSYTVDAVKSYLREIGRYPLLSKQEVYQLIAEGTDEAKNKVIQHNLRLAFCIAKKYQNRGVPLLDLVQESNLGLVKAVDRFDPNKGYTFGTYATWWCTATVRRCLQENTSPMRLPVYMVEMIAKINNAQRNFELANTEYTEKDLAVATGLKVSEVKKALAAKKNSEVLSLDYENNDDKDSIGKTIVDENENVEANYLKDERTQNLVALINEICTPREADILTRHFGFLGKKETFDELAAEYGVSKQRIGQLYKKGLEKLQTSKSKMKIRKLL